MKRILLPFIALFAAIGLTTTDIKAQEISIGDVPEYIHKEGMNFGALIVFKGFRSNLEVPLPRITVLEGDYINMIATSCSLNGSYWGGVAYKVNLEIAEASDFGERLSSHIRFRFEFEFEFDEHEYYDVDFWTIQPGLDIGSITPTSQNILFKESAQTLTYSTTDKSYLRSVQWQQKVGSGNWTDIPRETQYDYHPRYLTETTQFRIAATSKGGSRGYTEPVTVNVSPLFRPGTIRGNQTIISGYTPKSIFATSAHGGSGTIAYQWQSKAEGSPWTDIPGATSTTYQPAALSVTTYFRRKATCGPETRYSNTAMIRMKTPIADYLSFKPVANVVGEQDRDQRTMSLKTHEKVAVLGNGAAGKFVERVFYYDYRGRLIQTVEKNHLGGISRYSTKYDFAGNVLKNHEEHTAVMPAGDSGSGVAPDQKLTEFTYDHRSRLLTEKTTLNDSEPTTVNYTYDPLGQLVGKTYHNSGEPWFEPVTLDRIPVGTNIRGWTFRRDRAETSDVVNAPGFFLYPDGVVRLTATNGLEIEAYTEEGDWIWSSMTLRVDGNTRLLMDNGTWLDLNAPDSETFTIPDDQDYIVTSNNLPGGSKTDMPWCFARIAKVESDPEAIFETYDYNIQGWQTGQQVRRGDNELFSTNLHYYDPQFDGTAPSYTGNISEWKWQHGAGDGQNVYAFAYDRLSRLADTKQYLDGQAADRFVEKGLTYDLNGNMRTLNRTANGSAANAFRYTYTGNQLTTLRDSLTNLSHAYTYDANGNMVTDGPNDLSLTYNNLNLIEKVKKQGATLANYSYLADNTKLAATDAAGNGLYYLGSLVYKKQNETLSLESTGFSGGRFIATQGSDGVAYSPTYFVTDHLGSVRALVSSNGDISERNDYYPFGYRWQTLQSQVSDNRYRYNGKEEQAFVNVPYTDYGARMYDPRFGMRWNGVDPLTEKYYATSPFAYVANNPLKYIDPDGRDRRLVYDNKNRIITVQATYYHDINTGGYAKAGVKVFNTINNEANHTYTDKNGTTYSIAFDLQTKRSSNPKYDADNDVAGNYIKVKGDLGTKDDKKVLGLGGGKVVSLLDETKNDDFVVAHEMGHTLGAAMGKDNHAQEGLMVDNTGHPKKSYTLDQKSVNEIIEQGRGTTEERKSLWDIIKSWFSE